MGIATFKLIGDKTWFFVLAWPTGLAIYHLLQKQETGNRRLSAFV
jgi:hypothetical protein